MIRQRWRRRSQYVEVEDGTRIAVHVFRAEGPDRRLPALWCVDRYHLVHQLVHDPTTPLRGWLQRLLDGGFVVALMDVRGSGASFGRWDGPFSAQEISDARHIGGWLANQDFCTGRTGMIGRSYSAIVQPLVAAVPPTGLRALFLEMPMIDPYGFAHSGGILRHDFLSNWTARIRALDHLADAVPVDADPSRESLAGAQAEHRHNADPYDMAIRLPYRDSAAPDGSLPYLDRAPLKVLDTLRQTGLAVCVWSGWMDLWTADAIRAHLALGSHSRLVIGPWSHGGGIGTEVADAQIAWFTPLLQAEPAAPPGPPIRLYPWSTRSATRWRAEDTWPPTGGARRTLYFDADPAGPSTSAGTLTETAARSGSRVLPVDATITTGPTSRWANGYGEVFGYPDIAEHDDRCLTWTGAPARYPLLLIGHPIVDLFISCPAPDVDLFVTLSQVDPDGIAEYVSEGCLRATHRAETTDPLADLDVPLHSSTAAALAPIDGQVRLRIALHPIAVELAVGTRLRLALAQTDADNALNSPPVADVQVHFGPTHPSSLQVTAYPVRDLNSPVAV